MTRQKASTLTLPFADSHVVHPIWFWGQVSQGLADALQLMPCNNVSDGVKGPQDVKRLFLDI